MDKGELEIKKLIGIIIGIAVLVFSIMLIGQMKTYGSPLSNLFGKINESIGGVSWGDLTKAQRDIMNDKQKAESIFVEIDKELNRGSEKRKNEDFDGAKTAFEKALKLVTQVLNLKGITKPQGDKAKDLEKTLQYYLKDLKEYKDVADYVESSGKAEKDEALKILKACEEKYPRSVRSVDCVVRAYLLKVNPAFAHTVPTPAVKLLDDWLREQIARIQNDQKEIARLHLVTGEILFELATVQKYSDPTLLSKAIDHYNAVINNPDSKDLNDYVGRAHLRRAQIYRDYSRLLGYSDQKRYEAIKGEYDTLFKKLEKRDFVDKQEALNGQKTLNCFVVAASKEENGNQRIQTLAISNYGPIYFRVVSLDATRCQVSGQWQYKALLKKQGSLERAFEGKLSAAKDPSAMLYNDRSKITDASYLGGKNLRDYSALVFEAYKVENEKDRATLELPIIQ